MQLGQGQEAGKRGEDVIIIDMSFEEFYYKREQRMEQYVEERVVK